MGFDTHMITGNRACRTFNRADSPDPNQPDKPALCRGPGSRSFVTPRPFRGSGRQITTRRRCSRVCGCLWPKIAISTRLRLIRPSLPSTGIGKSRSMSSGEPVLTKERTCDPLPDLLPRGVRHVPVGDVVEDETLGALRRLFPRASSRASPSHGGRGIVLVVDQPALPHTSPCPEVLFRMADVRRRRTRCSPTRQLTAATEETSTPDGRAHRGYCEERCSVATGGRLKRRPPSWIRSPRPVHSCIRVGVFEPPRLDWRVRPFCLLQA
jgi:hypothetical protein